MASCRLDGAVKAGAICILLLLSAVGLLSVAGQAPEPEEPAMIEQADGGGGGQGNGNGTRGGGGARGGSAGGGGSSARKLASSIDCQICEATCRVKCLINNLFQWGGCYQRCKTDNCNDWCR